MTFDKEAEELIFNYSQIHNGCLVSIQYDSPGGASPMYSFSIRVGGRCLMSGCVEGFQTAMNLCDEVVKLGGSEVSA